MANKRQKKKAAKKQALGQFKGSQYKGGKAKGHKNLKREGKNIINQNGVVFTQKEQNRLTYYVNKVNKKASELEKELGALPRYVTMYDKKGNPFQKEVGVVSDVMGMGKEPDIFLARRSKSMQRFTSHEQFENYIESLKKVSGENYLTERARLYKRNFTKSLLEQYSYDECSDILMKIRMMKPEEYVKMLASHEELEIGYVYEDLEREGLNSIRSALGIAPKDDYSNEMYDIDDDEY
jgi:hypothetical protein